MVDCVAFFGDVVESSLRIASALNTRMIHVSVPINVEMATVAGAELSFEVHEQVMMLSSILVLLGADAGMWSEAVELVDDVIEYLLGR